MTFVMTCTICFIDLTFSTLSCVVKRQLIIVLSSFFHGLINFTIVRNKDVFMRVNSVTDSDNSYLYAPYPWSKNVYIINGEHSTKYIKNSLFDLSCKNKML